MHIQQGIRSSYTRLRKFVHKPVRKRERILPASEGVIDKAIIGQAPSSSAANGSFLGVVGGIASLAGAILGVVTLISCSLELKKDIAIIKARRKIKKIHETNLSEEARRISNYANRKIHRARRNMVRTGICMVATIGSLIQGGAILAMHFAPVAASAASTVLQVAGLVVAPLSMALSVYGLKRNITEYRGTKNRLDFVKRELERLETKYDGVEREKWSADDIDRVKLLEYSKRRLGDRRLRRIIGIAENSLLLIGAIFMTIGLASGPGATVIGTAGLVVMAVGAFGAIAARGILTLRKKRASKRRRQLGIRGQLPISGSSLRTRMITQIKLARSAGETVDYSRPVEQWKNHDLMQYILMRDIHQPWRRKKLDPEVYRDHLLVDASEQNHEEWQRSLK